VLTVWVPLTVGLTVLTVGSMVLTIADLLQSALSH
jgi:hypothetical protein